MRGVPAHRLGLALAALAVLGVGGGATLALSPTRAEPTANVAPMQRQPGAATSSPTPAASGGTVPGGSTSARSAPGVVPGAAGTGASGAAGPGGEGASGPGGPDPRVSDSQALTPSPAPSPAVPSGGAAAGSGRQVCPLGEYQRAVEADLTRTGGFGLLPVDGQQSAADCAAISAFQRRFGIDPADGRASRLTADVAHRLAVSGTAEEQRRCGAGSGLTICVDLTQQTAWVVRDGRLVLTPTVTRTGMAGYATPAGTYHVFRRNVREWSNPYSVWLPYWQAFNGGMGFHETTTYLHEASIGSHGCVNLLHNDAVALWNAATNGTTVRVFGRRAGT